MSTIIVSTELDGEYRDVGDLTFTSGPITNLGHFTYDPDWLVDGYELEPGLPLMSGRQTIRGGVPLSFLDASPDYWGRLLLQRKEERDADTERRPTRKLTDDMALLGASDFARQGALRFRNEHDGPFLSEEGVPRSIELGELLAAAEEVSSDPGKPGWKAIDRLLGTGAHALGGARPKAAVTRDGRLWLAKFPSSRDTENVPVWEKLALDVAERAGLEVPRRELVQVGGRPVLLVLRFDREGDLRIPYMRARTLMQAVDPGVVRDYGGAGGIATRLRAVSPRPTVDLQSLWRQAAVNVAVNNTDNHLKNHGLLFRDGGWTLSPVFDLNPNPFDGADFATKVGGGSFQRSAFTGLLNMADEFGVTPSQAREELANICDLFLEVAEHDAPELGVSDREIDRFRNVMAATHRMSDQARADLTASVIQPETSIEPSRGSGEIWVETHVRDGRSVKGHWKRRPRRGRP